MAPYEQAAFQAVSYLQGLYGFLVLDYNYHALLYYRRVAYSAIQLAAGAVSWAGVVDRLSIFRICFLRV